MIIFVKCLVGSAILQSILVPRYSPRLVIVGRFSIIISISHGCSILLHSTVTATETKLLNAIKLVQLKNVNVTKFLTEICFHSNSLVEFGQGSETVYHKPVAITVKMTQAS